MKKLGFLLLLLQVLFLSCRDNITEPDRQKSGEYTVGMNSQYVPVFKDNIRFVNVFKWHLLSSDTSLVDSTSIIIEQEKNGIFLTIYPRPGRTGSTFIKIVRGDRKKELILSLRLNVSDDKSNRDYPTKIFPLSATDLEARTNELNRVAGSYYHLGIDKYGLCDLGGLLSRGKCQIASLQEAVSLATKAIVFLSQFTNVTDTSLLLVSKADHNDDYLYTDWQIEFKNQIYNSIEVWNTNIQTIVTDDHVNILGHHYKNIFVPTKCTLSKERLKKELIGYKIIFYCFDKEEFEITESSINISEFKQVIYPYFNGDTIELRLTWKVPVSGWTGPETWVCFVDVITGDILEIIQSFMC